MTDIVIVELAGTTTVVVTQDAPDVVQVTSPGPQGPAGALLVRSVTQASVATLTPNIDSYDMYDLTAQAVALAVANPTGTPINGHRLLLRIKDNGSGQSITWGTAYVSGGVPLPTTTVAGKTQHLGFFYNITTAKWALVAGLVEG